MTAATTTPAIVPAIPWEDAYGRKHADIPACCAISESRLSYGGKTLRSCKRKGVAQRGTTTVYQDGGTAQRPQWFCLQHDPARAAEQRAARFAPELLDAVRELLPLADPLHDNCDCHRCRTVKAARQVLAHAEGRRAG